MSLRALLTKIRREQEESVKVKCFGCDALIEAANADAVVGAFVAHGQESHTWTYPEEAIRNYARNYAEAPPHPDPIHFPRRWRAATSRESCLRPPA